MMPSFNLIDEPWIPCLEADGRPSTLSIRETLVRAHELREATEPSPLVYAALHRLLLAVLHRNFGPASLQEWVELWGRGRWDEPAVNVYLDRWADRFDLFDEGRPFYQVRKMSDASAQPVAKLALELSGGNNATLFDHSFDDSGVAMEPARAARYLLACQAYSIGFGRSNPFYLKDAPLTRGYTVLVQGASLFETLMLNLVVYDAERPIPSNGQDAPWWEQDQPALPDAEGTVPLGYLDYLTWQSRRIHLVPEDDPPMVRQCQIQQNLRLAEGVLDPFKSYSRDAESGYVPRGLRVGRSAWRDSHALFENQSASGKRPDVFEWLAQVERLRAAGRLQLAQRYTFGLYGFATERGKAASVVLWRLERLPLPLVYLNDKDLRDALERALKLTEDVRNVLSSSMRVLAEFLIVPELDIGGRKPFPDDVTRLVNGMGVDRHYWSRLDTSFRQLLVELADDRHPDPDEPDEIIYGSLVLPRWADTVVRAARESAAEAINGIGTTARCLKAAAVAERVLKAGLRRTRKEYLEALGDRQPLGGEE